VVEARKEEIARKAGGIDIEGGGGGGRRGRKMYANCLFLKKDKRMEIFGKETKKQLQDTAAAISMNPGCFNWVEVERWVTCSNET
jgi:hypothetical protein